MADSSGSIGYPDYIQTAAAQKEATANALIDAASPSMLYGRRDSTTTGLTWGYYGGRYDSNNISNGTLLLTASQTNYIVALRSNGTISTSTSNTNWNDTTNYLRLFQVTTGVGTITGVLDYRQAIGLIGTGGGGGGSSLTQENVEDIIGGLVTAGSNVTVTYNDSASPATLVIDATTSGLNEEQVQDVVGALLTAGTGISLNYNDGDSPATLSIASTAGPSLTQEQIEDIVGSMITAGSGISVNYNDGDSPATLSITATGGGGGSLTQEQIEDIVGSLLTAGSGITLNYNDGDSPATLSIASTGGLTHFTESVTTAAPNATVPVVRFLATNAAAAVDIALSAKGDGALTAEVADNTTTGGNKRGINAVDWQMVRSTNSDVASGTLSVICGGSDNRVSGTSSAVCGGTVNRVTHNTAFIGGGNTNAVSQVNGTIAGGVTNTVSASAGAIGGGTSNVVSGADAAIPGGSSNTASGANSFSWGGNNIANSQFGAATGSRATTRAVVGSMARASGQFNVEGDAQTSLMVLRGATTNATPLVLTTNAGAAAATNQVTLENTSATLIDVRVAARSSADESAWEIQNLFIKRGANAAATALVGSPTVTMLQQSAGASTWVVAATADTTNGSLALTVTGVAATNIKWVATCRTVEVGG